VDHEPLKGGLNSCFFAVLLFAPKAITYHLSPALTPNKEYLYYIALTGHTLYRISTSALMNESLSSAQLAKHVETVAAVPATDGMMFDPEGNLWMDGLENNAINMINTKGKLLQVLQDPAIRWADSFVIDRKNG
jgi:sugar lactone lactonase YvrE